VKNNLLNIKIIIIFAIINSSYFIAFGNSGILRFISVLLMNISGLLIIFNYLKCFKLLGSMKVHYYFRILIFTLILWSFFTFFRSFSLDTKSLITLFGHPLMGWAWIAPMSVILGLNILIWENLLKYFSKILQIGIFIGLFSFFYPQEVNMGALEFFAFLPILLITKSYQRKKIRIITVFAIITYGIISYFVSQRVNLIYLFLIFVFSYSEYLHYLKNKNLIKSFWLILSLLFVYSAVSTTTEKNITNGNSELFIDNRSFLFAELFLDMEPNELLIGRGALGTYYSDFFHYASLTPGAQADNENRSVNEVGYLQMILKGGFVMLSLYILILFPIAILGIFKSKNTISRMCGYYILIYILCWSVSYYPIFSAEYILLWIAVGTILPKSNRMKMNSELLFNKINK